MVLDFFAILIFNIPNFMVTYYWRWEYNLVHFNGTMHKIVQFSAAWFAWSSLFLLVTNSSFCLNPLCLFYADSFRSKCDHLKLEFLVSFWIFFWRSLFSFQAKQHLALLCLGEIGRRKDLSSHLHIENIVIESFQSPFEEIKSAASYALGNIAVGNLSKYLPFILDQIDHQQKKQYLLLHSLKEVDA